MDKALPACELPYPKESNQLPDQYDHVLQLVIGAEKAGVIDAPAKSLQDFSDEDVIKQSAPILNPLRFHVITKQLWLLGYLKEKPRRNISLKLQNKKTFQKIIYKFQKDAGITQDGWLGEETWKTLQELVSFETPIDPKKWQLKSGQYRTAFNRALHLRLWAYGFIDTSPSPTFTGLKPKTLASVESTINDLCQTIPEGSSWLSILLNPDAMLEAAANVIQHASNVQNKAKLRQLLISIAKVELWLLGMDITINGQDDFSVSEFGARVKAKIMGGKKRMVKANNISFRKQLQIYWTSLIGYSEVEAKKKSIEITPEFFQSLLQPENFCLHIADVNEEPDFSIDSLKAFDSTTSIENAFNTYRVIGMKLWDGVKRLWRWIKKGISNIVSFSQNLIRGFFRFANKSYKIIRTAFLAFIDAIQQYLQGSIETTSSDVILLSKDFDYLSYLYDKADHTKTAKAIKKFSSQFLFSSKLISTFMQLLTTAVQGVIGWAKFLYILVKSYRELVPAYRELREY